MPRERWREGDLPDDAPQPEAVDDIRNDATIADFLAEDAQPTEHPKQGSHAE